MRTLIVNALRIQGKRTAMGRYIEALARHWSRMEVPFDKIVLLSASPQDVGELGTTTPIEIYAFGEHWPNLLWEQFVLPWAARKAALLFCPAYTCPLFHRGKIVLANHGIYNAVPGEFSWKARLRSTPVNKHSARRANRVLANSLSTKADLMKFYGVVESRLDVILPAADDLYFETHNPQSIAAEVRHALGNDGPYIIFVGKLAKRRHVPNLIKAFSVVRAKENLPHRLLIIGPNTTELPVQELIAAVGGETYIKYLPHMEMLPLAKLYAGADLYVLPTTYEGISWTMFEAMASGTAVLTVEHPTLAEGGSDAVFAVPSPSVEDLASGLTTLLTDEPLRRTYERKGKLRVSQFSWRRNAEVTMQVLDQVALPADR